MGNYMKVMSIDYGDVRTGIALSDVRGILASPYCVINQSSQPKLVDEIVKIIKENKVDKIVIGLPRNMDGSYGYRCDECKDLGNALLEKINIEVVYED